MALKQIDHGTPMYEEMVKLRSEILRKPLGLRFTEKELQKEKQDILIVCVEDETLLGCCILSKHDSGTLRLRQMAVKKNLQGKGIGESIMSFAENLTRDKGCNRIIMHARNSAIGFYEKLNYKVTGKEFTEVGLPHHVMEKLIL